MSRQWISKKDKRWVMHCDECRHDTEPRAKQADLPLEEFAQAGWFVAKLWGDWCPNCVSKAGGTAALVANGKEPHSVMQAVTS